MSITIGEEKNKISLKASPPGVGQWFTIKPMEIHWATVIFACITAKEFRLLENIRWARGEMVTTSKYHGKIETYIPVKDWEAKSEHELREMAKNFGSEMADEVIVYLEVAQRLHNGESLHTLTKDPDPLPSYRKFITRFGGSGSVGGSDTQRFKSTPTYVVKGPYNSDSFEFNAVPLVVRFSTT